MTQQDEPSDKEYDAYLKNSYDEINKTQVLIDKINDLVYRRYFADNRDFIIKSLAKKSNFAEVALDLETVGLDNDFSLFDKLKIIYESFSIRCNVKDNAEELYQAWVDIIPEDDWNPEDDNGEN